MNKIAKVCSTQLFFLTVRSILSLHEIQKKTLQKIQKIKKKKIQKLKIKKKMNLLKNILMKQLTEIFAAARLTAKRRVQSNVVFLFRYCSPCVGTLRTVDGSGKKQDEAQAVSND